MNILSLLTISLLALANILVFSLLVLAIRFFLRGENKQSCNNLQPTVPTPAITSKEIVVEHHKYPELMKAIEDIHKDIAIIKKDLHELLTRQSLSEMGTKYSQPVSKDKPDHLSVLQGYLKIQHSDKANDLLKRLQNMKDLPAEENTLRDQLVHLSMDSGLFGMSDSLILKLTQKANDYLETFGLALIAPTQGIPFDESQMNILKQFSASNRVKSLVHFGISQHSKVLVKADVNVG